MKHHSDSRTFVVTGNYGGRVTAVATVDITNPPEWKVVLKAEGRKPKSGTGGKITNKRSERATDPVTNTVLLAVLGDAPAARLTAEKSETVQKRDGYRITGFVLHHPETGERCIVEMSAVRWLSKEESWWLMHESTSPIHSAKHC